jgi:hypothetical protein
MLTSVQSNGLQMEGELINRRSSILQMEYKFSFNVGLYFFMLVSLYWISILLISTFYFHLLPDYLVIRFSFLALLCVF